jgi:hypothetical protein
LANENQERDGAGMDPFLPAFVGSATRISSIDGQLHPHLIIRSSRNRKGCGESMNSYVLKQDGEH